VRCALCAVRCALCAVRCALCARIWENKVKHELKLLLVKKWKKNFRGNDQTVVTKQKTKEWVKK
jgi:hypothetical protein